MHNIHIFVFLFCVMNKTNLILLYLLLLTNVSYASFPMNNINNVILNQSEIISKSSPNYSAILGITLILSYLGTILWYVSKPIPKDVKKRKIFYRKLLLIIFIPLIIVGILVIHSLNNMSIDISVDDFVQATE